jgi:dihydroorotase
LRLCIRSGRIIDPANHRDETGGVLIEDGIIAAVGPEADAPDACETIDASGLWVTPGWIDLHTHLREPGFEYKETVYQGAGAALKGGFTTICAMPNTNPVTDCAEIVNFVHAKAQEAGGARVLPIGSLTEGQKGARLSRMEDMAAAGVCAFSEDGKSVADAFLMKEALRKSGTLGLPVFLHCEEPSLVRGGVMHESAAARRLGLPSISADAEEVIIARDLILAQYADVHIHICHISTAGGVRLLRQAKQAGVRASGEVCPHHFTLCCEDIPGDDGMYKMNPPLRSARDRLALWEGLADGTIDAIATDHAPHAPEEKNKGFMGSAFGVAGLETALALCVTRLVRPKILTPSQLIQKCAANPAKILGIGAGTLSVGARADITLIDPQKEIMVNPETFFSKGKNTPFGGWKLIGAVVCTIMDGRIVYANDHR